jgi:hypothetical protein
MQMVKLVQKNLVTLPLLDPTQFPAGITNTFLLLTHVASLWTTSFPNLSSIDTLQFCGQSARSPATVAALKTMLLDVLITLTALSADDNATLSLHREEQERLAKKRKRAIKERSAIPGMVKPVDIVDDDEL